MDSFSLFNQIEEYEDYYFPIEDYLIDNEEGGEDV